jgi:thioredoxin reductase
MARRLASNVMIYTGGDETLASEVQSMINEGVDPLHMKVDARPLASLEKGSTGAQVILHFQDGDRRVEGFLVESPLQKNRTHSYSLLSQVHHPKTEINGPFAEQLSLDLTETGEIRVLQPFNETSMPGVFAAGDCATPFKAVTIAMATGSCAAGGLAAQLHSISDESVILQEG